MQEQTQSSTFYDPAVDDAARRYFCTFRSTTVDFFSGFPETTAPELTSSSILGSRSDKPVQFDRTTEIFQNALQTLGLTWFGGVSATSGVAFFTSTFLRSAC